MTRFLTLILFAVCFPAIADDHGDGTTTAKIEAAMTADRRSEAEVARDRNRKPVETLEFFGLKDDMTVLELLPGGGWYTNLLGPTLEENGKLYLSIGAERVWSRIEGEEGFGSTELIPFDRENFSRAPGAMRTTVPEFSFGIDGEVDMALTFRNMHNFDEEGRNNINRAVFDALKSGGVYGVVDHTNRHMAPDYSETRRRMDPVQVIKEVQAVGFEFVDYTDLHYRPDDELRYEVGRASVTGNTDRFTLLFRKP